MRSGSSVVVDGVFPQLYQMGIARVWSSLLEEWSKTGFGKRLVVIERAGTAPRFEGLRYVALPAHAGALLQRAFEPLSHQWLRVASNERYP